MKIKSNKGTIETCEKMKVIENSSSTKCQKFFKTKIRLITTRQKCQVYDVTKRLGNFCKPSWIILYSPLAPPRINEI